MDMYLHESEKLQAEIDAYNAKQGVLNIDHRDSDGVVHKGDGINCDYCKNRGSVMMMLTDKGGTPYPVIKVCDKCSTQRHNAIALRKAGLERLAKRYTFNNFRVDSEWQGKLLSLVRKYVEHGAKNGAWLYIGGQSGSGKSMLCTAATVELMKRYDALYAVWTIETRKIKGFATDTAEYNKALERIQTVPLLYIDDFFKPVFDANGMDIAATRADIMLAYNIINYRYNNDLPTIISSEFYGGDIAKIDEAVFGRIYERCGEYMINITRDKAKNYRTRTATTL